MAASDVEHLHKLAVHAYYVGEHDVGRRACERLLSEPLSPERESLVRANRTWYQRTLDQLIPDAEFLRFDVQPARPGWTCFNPTICRTASGYVAVVRSSNYRCINGQYVMPAEDAGRIRTENILVALDHDFSTQNATVLTDDYPRSDFPVDGLEDVRLDGPQVSATIRNWQGRDGLARIATGWVDGHTVTDIQLLDEPVPGRHEKNWMPICGTSKWLYSCHDHGRVVTAEIADGRWDLTPRGSSPAVARQFRGGSQLVRFEGGWICVIHEAAELDGCRVYEHRFVLFDADFNLVACSPPFAFRETRTIEFAAGLAWCHDDHRLVVTFGLRDEEAWLVTVPASGVMEILRQ